MHAVPVRVLPTMWSVPHFLGGSTFAATKPGVALKLLTGLPVPVFQMRTSPLAAPPATSWPSLEIATAYTQSVMPDSVLSGVPATGFHKRTVMSALQDAIIGFFASE